MTSYNDNKELDERTEKYAIEIASVFGYDKLVTNKLLDVIHYVLAEESKRLKEGYTPPMPLYEDIIQEQKVVIKFLKKEVMHSKSYKNRMKQQYKELSEKYNALLLKVKKAELMRKHLNEKPKGINVIPSDMNDKWVSLWEYKRVENGVYSYDYFDKPPHYPKPRGKENSVKVEVLLKNKTVLTALYDKAFGFTHNGVALAEKGILRWRYV